MNRVNGYSKQKCINGHGSIVLGETFVYIFVIVDYLVRKSFRNLKSSDRKVVARQLQNVAVCQAERETRHAGKHSKLNGSKTCFIFILLSKMFKWERDKHD